MERGDPLTERFDGERRPLREPTSARETAHAERCPCREGLVRTAGNQDTVRCADCGDFLYNAPRVETGRAVRTVTTVHNGIKPKQRARVLMRDGARCRLCKAEGVPLHVGHILSVDAGMAQGLNETQLNSDSNLMALCDQCNLGMGNIPMPLWLACALLVADLENKGVPKE